MAFDLDAALAASSQLSSRNAELSGLRDALISCQGQLRECWSGPDQQQVDYAIDILLQKINDAQRYISSVCRHMNRGAAALKTKEDTERMESQIRALNGGLW